jgi:membrane protein implicated in regulation of membrane protease activity
VIWAIIAVLLALGELATPGLFFLGLVAVAAVPAALVDLLGGPAWLQVLVFIVASLATVGILRPIARAHLHMPALSRTGTAALVGARALVLERVDVNGGRVRIGGEEWSARAYMDDQVLEPGARVEVAKIEGATALVYE